MSNEPKILSAGMCDGFDGCSNPVFVIRCGFSDGQEFGAVEVDGSFPELATRIAEFLNTPEPSDIQLARQRLETIDMARPVKLEDL